MKLLSNSGLVTVAAAGLLLTTLAPASMAVGCGFSKGVSPDVTSSLDGPAGFLTNTPDSNALGAALGGFGGFLALLTGGTVLYRKRRLAQVTDANAAAISAESDLAFETETVMVETTALAETETPEEVVVSR